MSPGRIAALVALAGVLVGGCRRPPLVLEPNEDAHRVVIDQLQDQIRLIREDRDYYKGQYEALRALFESSQAEVQAAERGPGK